MSITESPTPPLSLRRLWRALLARGYNVHQIAPGVYRSAQLYGRHVGVIARHFGFRSIVNLRGENPKAAWYRNEIDTAREMGIKFYDLRLSSKRLPGRKSLIDMLLVFEAMERPAMLKCSGGADRSSLACGLYLLAQGKSLSEARRQTARLPYLHFPKRAQRWIRGFFDFIEAENAAGDIRAWLETGYDPDRFANFLRAKGLGDAWKE